MRELAKSLANASNCSSASGSRAYNPDGSRDLMRVDNFIPTRGGCGSV